ncbi:plipastatin synthase subunit E-like [Sitodiplosis mosellana]|uniref:plipastatin synthase subunit E-like n=1 Tax=Sitodiplosis mosellana TaxID=263140 RepID=UPI002443C2DF|nr:plipastatin synthase subunit E-like [Sitodiplosis mosellana]
MVPVAYVCLPSLPLTSNGKLDRRALPAPDDEAFARQQYEAPQGEMEEKLAEIWRELLGIDRISRYDNFFELGGHSLLVMQFVNKAKLCNINIEARGVFSFPVLKDLAKQISHHSNRMYCDVAIPVRQYGNETPLFLLPEGEGGISYAFELAHDIDKNIPVYVLPWSSPEIKQPSSIEEMANAMISLMKKIQTNGPYAIAGYSPGGILAYEMAKQLINSGCSVSFLGLIDTYLPIENILTETTVFLTSVLHKFPVFQTLNDSKWWERANRFTLNEAIEEIRKTYVDLKNTDIEWEALLSKQRHHYRNICAAFKFASLPMKVHLFKAVDRLSLPDCIDHLNNLYKNEMDYFKKFSSFPMLGWENYNLSTDFHVISADGDHGTMMTDPKNRALLGKQITKSHRQGQNQ